MTAPAPRGVISKDWRGFKVIRTDVMLVRHKGDPVRHACRPGAGHRSVLKQVLLPAFYVQVAFPLDGQEYAVSGLTNQTTADLFLDAMRGGGVGIWGSLLQGAPQSHAPTNAAPPTSSASPGVASRIPPHPMLLLEKAVLEAALTQRPREQLSLCTRRSDQDPPHMSAATRSELAVVGPAEAIRQLQACALWMQVPRAGERTCLQANIARQKAVRHAAGQC